MRSMRFLPAILLVAAAFAASPAVAAPFFQQKDTAAGHWFGTTSSQACGFFGVTPTAQRSGAAQVAVTATPIAAAVGSTPTKAEYDAAVARINALTTLTNELRATLVANGLIKGGT